MADIDSYMLLAIVDLIERDQIAAATTFLFPYRDQVGDADAPMLNELVELAGAAAARKLDASFVGELTARLDVTPHCLDGEDVFLFLVGSSQAAQAAYGEAFGSFLRETASLDQLARHSDQELEQMVLDRLRECRDTQVELTMHSLGVNN